MHAVRGRVEVDASFLIISWIQYVDAFMPVRNVLSCMGLRLYTVFACVFDFYLWFKKKKKKRRP